MYDMELFMMHWFSSWLVLCKFGEGTECNQSEYIKYELLHMVLKAVCACLKFSLVLLYYLDM